MYATDLKSYPATLPTVKGFKILIAMPLLETKTKGGIHLPDDHRGKEEMASILGHVVAMGPECYADKDRFPNGPWCAVGDWVIFRSYAGTRFKVGDQEYRLINDDTVEAVATKPEEVKRA